MRSSGMCVGNRDIVLLPHACWETVFEHPALRQLGG